MTETDILIAGGGIAGMVSALALAEGGRTVTCVDPAPADAQADLRSTAFLMPSIALLQRLGTFDALADDAVALTTMRIADAGAAPPRIQDFTAAEAGHDRFGWNIPNTALRQTLTAALAAAPGVTVRYGTRVTGMVPRLSDTVVSLSDGTRVRARLLVAADGRDSTVRAAAGIGTRRMTYGQRALVFTVHHDTPHAGISTEVHRDGGPFTLVPLAGAEQTHSAVVWMAPGPDIAAFEAMSDPDFAAAVNERGAGVVPPLTPEGPRASFPIIAQYAQQLTGPRLALIAEAAHVVPPIGAQGLNTSLADISALAERLAGNDDPGAPAVLDSYSHARAADVRARVMGVDALNRASMAGAPLLQDLRQRALALLATTPTLRKAAISAGLGRATARS